MRKAKDIISLMDKEQRTLLKALRSQVSDTTKLVTLVAAAQEGTTVRKDQMQLLGIIGSRVLTDKEIEMAKQGISLDELRKICGNKMIASERTLSLRDSLPHDHILRLVCAEHDVLLYCLASLENIAKSIDPAAGWKGNERHLHKLEHILQHIFGLDAHHVREEQVIFPQLAEHGYGPAAQDIFAEHDMLRKGRLELEAIGNAINTGDFNVWKQRFDDLISSLVPAVRTHIYKEENIVFADALKVIQDPEVWELIGAICDEIGICGLHTRL
jgi:uncharacterized protein